MIDTGSGADGVLCIRLKITFRFRYSESHHHIYAFVVGNVHDVLLDLLRIFYLSSMDEGGDQYERSQRYFYAQIVRNGLANLPKNLPLFVREESLREIGDETDQPAVESEHKDRMPISRSDAKVRGLHSGREGEKCPNKKGEDHSLEEVSCLQFEHCTLHKFK